MPWQAANRVVQRAGPGSLRGYWRYSGSRGSGAQTSLPAGLGWRTLAFSGLKNLVTVRNGPPAEPHTCK